MIRTGSYEVRNDMGRMQIESNPPYGEKGQFRKITATVPQEIYERLVQESARRKIAGEPNQLLSALLREALSQYLAQFS